MKQALDRLDKEGETPTGGEDTDMGSDLPLWVQSVAIFATPTIALGLFIVAFMQWRTAHQKVVLDLFERRLTIYEETKAFLRKLRSKSYRLPSQAGQKEFISKLKALARIAEHHPVVFDRYMLMDQKLVRSPAEWLQRNRKRL